MSQSSDETTSQHKKDIKDLKDDISDDAEEAGEDNCEFYFESDHVALKNNADYRNLLKTLAILEAQQYRALKDIDTIIELKRKVTKDPDTFIDGIINGTIEIPQPQKIPSLPQIDWSRYNIPLSEVNKIPGEPSVQKPPENVLSKSKFLVRGRAYDASKPETFNQLWTVEEQQRLEELLVKYPPEEIETNRWRKIAAELGNRTAKQVCSRVQKYFLKLQKAGLPVPGRVPKAYAQAEAGKKSSHSYQRKWLKPTTFFPQQEVPVNLTDPDEMDFAVSSPSNTLLGDQVMNNIVEFEESEDENSFKTSKIKSIMNSRKLEIMRKVLKVKGNGEFCNFSNVGFKCNFCSDDPIVGVRWTCTTCASVDFCTDCVITQLNSDTPHPLSHNITPVQVRKEKIIYDTDYCPTSFSEPGCSYNYLDPNFLPGGEN